jgi:hypothetical protein
VRCVLGEARAAVAMMIHVLGVLAEAANLVDKLHDVRADRRRGEIALSPGLELHARLFGALVRRAVRLLVTSPRPFRLVAWGARYLLPPARA